MKTIFYNGHILTMDKEKPNVQALIIDENKFLKIGTNEEILELKDSNTTVINLQSKSLLPGFNDSHMHLVNFSNSLRMIALSKAKSIDDLIQLGKDYLNNNPNIDGWIMGRGWNQDNFNTKRFPTRYDLDKISTDKPVCFIRACCHVIVVNSKALELINLNKESKQIEGGHFDVDENNNPLGILRENACHLVYKAIPSPDIDDIKNMIIKGSKLALSKGITSIQTDDFNTFPDRDFNKIIKAYEELHKENNLPIRIYEQCIFSNNHELTNFLSLGYNTGYGNDFFKIGPLKLLADGSLGARTAYLSEPYFDEPTTSGIGTFTQDELDEIVLNAHKNNMQIAIHCIGDKIMDMSLNSIEKALKLYPKDDHRHGIVHAQITTQDLMNRLKNNNAIAYIQPIFLDYDIHIVEDRVGPIRATETYNFKTLMDMGVRTPYGSDCPVESFDVFNSIHCAINRTDLSGYPDNGWLPSQKVTLEDALSNYTLEGAYASFDEDIKGMIKENYLADFVILDGNISSTNLCNIKDLDVLMTYVDGKLKYLKQY